MVRKMHKAIAALFALILMAETASASDTLDAMRTVWRFVGSFNKGDVKSALDECAPQTSIIDEFPPYLWQGASGCAEWSADFDAYIKKNGMTGPKVTLGVLRHVDVSGDRAYVVIPASFSFRKNGRRFSERNSTLTLALQKVAESWRITGWAWAKH
jgi:ketosteroid isomerase-like protein